MHPDLLKILSHSDQPIDNEKLIAYLTGQLSPAESQQVEEQLAASGIDEEALDGLMMLNKHKVSAYQQELDLFLKKQIKTEKRKKHKPLGISWGWLAAATGALIVLAILLWYIVHFLSTKS